MSCLVCVGEAIVLARVSGGLTTQITGRVVCSSGSLRRSRLAGEFERQDRSEVFAAV